MDKTCIILNPHSANDKGARVWLSIEAALRAGGMAFDLARTTGPLQAIQFAHDAKRDGYVNVIAVGGDGTTNEVVNGLMRAAGDGTAGTLGIIPIGSGNDFAKMFPAPRTPSSPQPNWQTAVQNLLNSAPRLVDVCQVTASRGTESASRYFLNALDTGFAAQANKHAHSFPQLTSTAMYLAAIFKTLIKFAIDDLKLTLDDRTINQTSTLITVGNGRCIGGGFWMSPNAQPDDGLFDVTVADGLGRAGILSLIPKVMKGTHITDPRVKVARSARVIVESAKPFEFETDGEIWFDAVDRLDIHILPKRLRVIG
ncbi:MAG: diacylglycerol kinase family lipid kinase [Chloroflexi bacterium]|nr:diacylglycerol kinase family lipid kinase [Chloroflexota bacterium]